MSSNHEADFDFIVCGAGASGSVVARRLAENPNVQVLLIEAGGDDDSELVYNPRKALENFDTERDWQYQMQPNAALDGRSIRLPAGKGFGGGSSINFMYWSRGHKTDWDFFAHESGESGWSFDSVNRIYERVENWLGTGDPLRRSARGIVPVTPDALSTNLTHAVSGAFKEHGSPRYNSVNGALLREGAGHGARERNIAGGHRVSAFAAYVRPFMGRPNLRIFSNCIVLRLNFEEKRITGVSVQMDGKVVDLRARHEVVLSTGAIQTPKILMLSGIGARQDLERHDIAFRHHLPGVGRNLQDHVLMQGCNWLSSQAGAEAAANGIVGFFKSKLTMPAPDLHFIFTGFMTANNQIAKRFGYPEGKYLYPQGWGINIGLLHPFSRGTVQLADANPASNPIIDGQMLSDRRDEQSVLDAILLARSIGNSPLLQPFATKELSPGNISVEETRKFMRQASGTYFHPSSTAKMGMDDLSVVDGNLKVHGLNGLRIADASIMPRIPGANTMAPCIVIGERASDLIKSAYSL